MSEIAVPADLEYCVHTLGATPEYSKGFWRFPLPDLAGGVFLEATLGYAIHPLNPQPLDVNVHTLTQPWDGTESAETLDGWDLGAAMAFYTVPAGSDVLAKAHDVTAFVGALYGLGEDYASFALEAPTVTGAPVLRSGGVTLGWEQTVENDKEFHDPVLTVAYEPAAAPAAPAEWPAALPRSQNEGLRYWTDSGVLRSSLAGDVDRARRRSRQTRHFFRTPAAFTGEQMAAWEAFLAGPAGSGGLAGGALPFLWDSPVTDEPVLCRLTRTPAWSLYVPAPQALRVWRGEIEVEILEFRGGA